MKKALIAVACAVVSLSAYAQGTLNFNNRVPANSIDAPVFNVGNTVKLEGTGFLAQIYAGPTADSLAAVGVASPFRTGAGAGYINAGANAAVSVPTVAPGANAFVRVRAWDTSTGATYEAAGIKGESALLTIATGGVGAPPSLPANLVGLTSFSLVPEPSTIALGVLGAAALLLRRRK